MNEDTLPSFHKQYGWSGDVPCNMILMPVLSRCPICGYIMGFSMKRKPGALSVYDYKSGGHAAWFVVYELACNNPSCGKCAQSSHTLFDLCWLTKGCIARYVD